MGFIFTSESILNAERRANLLTIAQTEECMRSAEQRKNAIAILLARQKEVDQEVKTAELTQIKTEEQQARLRRLKEIQANIAATLSRCR